MEKKLMTAICAIALGVLGGEIHAAGFINQDNMKTLLSAEMIAVGGKMVGLMVLMLLFEYIYNMVEDGDGEPEEPKAKKKKAEREFTTSGGITY